MNLIELTHKNDILQTYEIYKHCMFMPTEEKFMFLSYVSDVISLPAGLEDY